MDNDSKPTYEHRLDYLSGYKTHFHGCLKGRVERYLTSDDKLDEVFNDTYSSNIFEECNEYANDRKNILEKSGHTQFGNKEALKTPYEAVVNVLLNKHLWGVKATRESGSIDIGNVISAYLYEAKTGVEIGNAIREATKEWIIVTSINRTNKKNIQQ